MWYHGSLYGMPERIPVRRMILVASAFAFTAILFAYLYVQQLFTQNAAKLTLGGECADDAGPLQVQKVNPNKILFISCGGFLD